MTAPLQGVNLEMENETEYWGISTNIDLYECDLALMQNSDAIREFVKILCDRIKMKQIGRASCRERVYVLV